MEKKSKEKPEIKKAPKGRLSKWGHRPGSEAAMIDEAIESGSGLKFLFKKLMSHSERDEKWAKGRLSSHLNHLDKAHKVKVDPETLKEVKKP